ncbi:hypothetical protein ACN38_g11384 [Penicillium nordicum]|uniref:Uncharacterized protein n=1 Tax=Penicillium nordicum TaxID=229535 RepID=A0A0M9WAS6_9EURO|nr:hypothetical protein ACN38_g11384 [Penicillium nordicum]
MHRKQSELKCHPKIQDPRVCIEEWECQAPNNLIIGRLARLSVVNRLNIITKINKKTYNSEDSPVVTHPTTNSPGRVAYVRPVVGWVSPG